MVERWVASLMVVSSVLAFLPSSGAADARASALSVLPGRSPARAPRTSRR